MERKHKLRGLCHYGSCEEKAVRAFISKNGRMQQQKYCLKHAREVKDNGAFPKCEISYIRKWIR